MGQMGQSVTQHALRFVCILAVSIAIPLILWTPLAAPSQAIRDMLPVADCNGKTVGTIEMYWCAAGVGLLQLSAPIVLMSPLVLSEFPSR